MIDILSNIENDTKINNDGTLNPICNFCKLNFKSSTCQTFYEKLQNLPDDIYTCPYGFNCIKFQNRVYNALLIRDYYRNKKISMKKDKFQKIFNIQEITDLIHLDSEMKNLKVESEQQQKNIADFLHDTTKANKLIETKIRNVSKNNLNNVDKRYIESVEHLSNFITRRVNLYRYVNNPELIKAGRFRKIDAYKLWDVYRFIFNDLANDKNLNITMEKYDENNNIIHFNNTPMYINAKDSISILPFLLIDNAIRYSKEYSVIYIQFYLKYGGALKTIKIKSSPNYNITDDVSRLFERGYRSQSNNSKSSGSGLGLNIVQSICHYNNIKVQIKVDEEMENEFCVIMDF